MALQYKEFCGGCTALAVGWAPWSAVFGEGYLAWKALALARTAAVMGLAFVAMDRWMGRSAAFAALLLLAIVPGGHAELSLMLWSNHVDSAVPVLAALCLSAPGRSRPLWAGLALGLGVFAGRTALYGAVLAPWLLVRDRDPRVLVGFAIGLLPIALPAAVGDGGDYRFVPPLALDTVRAVLERQRFLWDPRELGLRLLPGQPAWLAGAALAAAALGLIRAGRRGLVLVALIVSFAAAFGLSPVPIPAMGPEGLPLNARFFAPWMLLLALGAACGAGGRLGWAIVGLGLVGGVASQGAFLLRSNNADAPEINAVQVDDPARFSVMISNRLPAEVLCEARALDAAVQHGLSRACGGRLGAAVVAGEAPLGDALAAALRAPSPDGALWGLGLALSTGEVEALNEAIAGHPRALADGVAQGLGLSLARRAVGPFALGEAKLRREPPPDPRRRVKAELAWLRGGLPVGAPCLLCAAAGEGAAESCGAFGPRVPPELELCLAESLRVAGDDGPAVAFGAGLALARRRDQALGERLGQKLGPDFLRGFQHPAAGLDVLVRE